MLAKAKAGMFAAGDATARGAKRAKINAEILVLQGKVKDTKKQFGLEVYDKMLADDKAGVERAFMETRSKIEAFEADISSKRQQVLDLQEPGIARNSAAESMAVPPPGPPPTAPPPGWRGTKTAEGKEYFFNEATGETSWTMPSATPPGGTAPDSSAPDIA